MNKTFLAQKQAIVSELVNELNESKSILVFEYHGLNATDTTILRRKLHVENAKLHILKNSILNRAIENSNLKGFTELAGPNALIISKGNEVISFKLIDDLMKDKTFVQFKGGIIEGNMISVNQLSTIASIPGRDGLYSMLLSCLQAPIRNFMYGLKAISATKN